MGIYVSLLIFFIGGCTSKPLVQSPAITPAPLSAIQYDQVVFGSLLSDTEKLLKEKSIPLEKDHEPDCYYVRFAKYPEIDFMVEDGRIVRADTDSVQIPLDENVSLGQTVEDIRKKFPNAKIEPHKYADNDFYVIFYTQQKKNALILETSEHKTKSVRAGTMPAAGYIEGCY